MGVSFMVITVVPDQHMLDADAFLRQARRKWPGCRTFENDPAAEISDAEVDVNPAGAPSFTVTHFPNDMISVDGIPDQSAEFFDFLIRDGRCGALPDPGHQRDLFRKALREKSP